MSAEVRRLTGAGPVTGPVEEIVERLTELLAAAKAGEIKGLGYFYVSGAGAVVHAWESGCANEAEMVAGASLLQHRVLWVALS